MTLNMLKQLNQQDFHTIEIVLLENIIKSEKKIDYNTVVRQY